MPSLAYPEITSLISWMFVTLVNLTVKRNHCGELFRDGACMLFGLVWFVVPLIKDFRD